MNCETCKNEPNCKECEKEAFKRLSALGKARCSGYEPKTMPEIIKEVTEAYNQNLNAGCYVGDLLRIINHQQAEIEVSQRRIATLEKLAEHRKKAVFERVERNLELRKKLEIAKAEAYKECIEKVKLKSSSCVATKNGIVVAGSRTYTVSEINLANILNELVGDA